MFQILRRSAPQNDISVGFARGCLSQLTQLNVHPLTPIVGAALGAAERFL